MGTIPHGVHYNKLNKWDLTQITQSDCPFHAEVLLFPCPRSLPLSSLLHVHVVDLLLHPIHHRPRLHPPAAMDLWSAESVGIPTAMNKAKKCRSQGVMPPTARPREGQEGGCGRMTTSTRSSLCLFQRRPPHSHPRPQPYLRPTVFHPHYGRASWMASRRNRTPSCASPRNSNDHEQHREAPVVDMPTHCLRICLNQIRRLFFAP